MKITLLLTVALMLFAGVVYGYRFAMKDAMNMYSRSRKPMQSDHRKGLLAELSAIDQQIAELEGRTGSECDDATLQQATRLLAEVREIREHVEGKLREE